MKNKKVLLLILPAITLILEALPFGAVLNFANPEGASFTKTFSYFSLIPFGYANFSPFITAVITCVAFGALVAYCLTDKRAFFTLAKHLLCAGLVLSLFPLAFGIKLFSLVAVLISVSLFAELLLVFWQNKSLQA